MDLITYALLQGQISGSTSKSGSDFDFTYNQETGELTFRLKNNAGDILASHTLVIKTTAVIKEGYYDETTQEIVFILNDETSTEIRIPVGDLIDNVKSTLESEIAAESERAIAAEVDLDTRVTENTETLAAKQDKFTIGNGLKLVDGELSTDLKSGVDVKTINTQSILGEGNITIPVITVDKTLSASSTNPVENAAIYSELVGKVTRAELEALSATVLKIAEVKQNGLDASRVTTDKINIGTLTPIEIYRQVTKELEITADSIKISGNKDYKDKTTTELATMQDVHATLAELIDAAPETLDTLGKIAEALKEGQGTIQAIMTAIDTKASKSSLSQVAFTGNYDDLFNKPQIVDRNTPVSYFLDDGTYVKTGAAIFDKLATKEYVDQRAKAKFTYKGKKQTYEELLQVTGMIFGDFWWVVEPKEEGQEGNMSYIWQDDDSWHEFMPMGQGGGGGETSIIHVDELPEVDQEFDKLYQMTTPKSYTDIYVMVQRMFFKNEFRMDGGRITAKVVDVDSLDILDPSPIYNETYDQTFDEGKIEIVLYRYNDQFYYWSGQYYYNEETGEEYIIAVGDPQLFDEDHPAFPMAHKYQGQADIDYCVEQKYDLELGLANAEPWPGHQMFTLTVTDEDGNDQVCHFKVVENDDPEPNGDDPDQESVKHWGVEGDNEYFYRPYEQWAIRLTDSTTCTDPMANKWFVQYRVCLEWLINQKHATNIRLEVDEENFDWWAGEFYVDSVLTFGGIVEGQKDCIIGIPYHEGTITERSDYDEIWAGYDINWGEKVFDWRDYEADPEDESAWTPMYYYGFGECHVPNEDGDIVTFNLRTYSTIKTEANKSYSLDRQLAVSKDRRNNTVFEWQGTNYKVVDALDEETGMVMAALVTDDEDMNEFPYASFMVACDDAYLFDIDSDATRKVKIPVTHDGQTIAESKLRGYNAIVKLRKESDSQYYAEWYDKDNPTYMITNTSTWTVEDGYAIFDVYYFTDYPTKYLFDDIIAGLIIKPAVDNRIAIYHELEVPTYAYNQPMEMGGSYGKASLLSFYSALSNWDSDNHIRFAVSDKLFYVNRYSAKIWFQNTNTDINEMYMYDESKFRKLITEKDFEEASSNFITPDNIKDYVKISNFVYWDSDRALPNLDDADGNKFYVKNGTYYHANKDRWEWKQFDSIIDIPDNYKTLQDYFNAQGTWARSDKLYGFSALKFDDSKLESYFYYKSPNRYTYATNAGGSPYGQNYKPLQVFFAKWNENRGYPVPEERFVCHSSDPIYKVCVVDTKQGEGIYNQSYSKNFSVITGSTPVTDQYGNTTYIAEITHTLETEKEYGISSYSAWGDMGTVDIVFDSDNHQFKLTVHTSNPNQWVNVELTYYSYDLTRFKLYYLDYVSDYGWREITVGSQIFSGPIYKGTCIDWGYIPEQPTDGSLYIRITDTYNLFKRTKNFYYYNNDNNGNSGWYTLNNVQVNSDSLEPVESSSSDTQLVKQVEYIPSAIDAKENVVYNWKSAKSYMSDYSTWTFCSLLYGRKTNELRTDTYTAATMRYYNPALISTDLQQWAIAYPFGRVASGSEADYYRAGYEFNSYNNYIYLRTSYNLSRKSITFCQKAYVDEINREYKVNQSDGYQSSQQYQSLGNSLYLPLVLLESWVNLNRNKIPDTSEYTPSDDNLVYHLGYVKGTDNYGNETEYDLGIYNYIYYNPGYRLRLKSPNRTVYIDANYYNETYFSGYQVVLGGLCGSKYPVITIKVDTRDALGAFMFFDQKDWNNNPELSLPYFYGPYTNYPTCPFSNDDGSSKFIYINNGVRIGEELFRVTTSDGQVKIFYFMMFPGEYQKTVENPNQYFLAITDSTNIDDFYTTSGNIDYTHIYAANSYGTYSDYTAAKFLTHMNNRTYAPTWESEQETPIWDHESFSLEGGSWSLYAKIPQGKMKVSSPHIIAGFMKKPQIHEDSNLVDVFASTDITSTGDLNTYISDFKQYDVNALLLWSNKKWTYIDISGNIEKKLNVKNTLTLTNNTLDVNMTKVADNITPVIDEKINQKVKKYYMHDIEINMNDYNPTYARFNLISSRSDSFLTGGMSNKERFKMMISYLNKPVLVRKNNAVHMGYLSECYEQSGMGVDNFIFRIEFTDGTDPIQMQGAGFYVAGDHVEEVM